MRISLLKLVWFFVAIAMAWGIDRWTGQVAIQRLDAARSGDRRAAEFWIRRTLDESDCQPREAGQYMRSDTRNNIALPEFVEMFVGKLYDGGATNVEICDSVTSSASRAQYLLVGLPADEESQESVIANAQSLIRRRGLVYQGVPEDLVEELVRSSTLIGEDRVLVDIRQ